MLCRQPAGRPSAGSPPVQSRAPRSGLHSDYATLIRTASPLHDASTIRGDEMASTLTLLPLTRRGRESTGGCQVLRFAACLTRPDGTSARVPRRPSPVESTHPQVRTSVRRTKICYHGPRRPPRLGPVTVGQSDEMSADYFRPSNDSRPLPPSLGPCRPVSCEAADVAHRLRRWVIPNDH